MRKEKRQKQKKFLLFAGVILVVFGLFVEAVLFSLRYENLWSWYYDGVLQWLEQLENRILSLKMSWAFFLAIMALYVIKCLFPIYTTSTVFFITGAVMPMEYSIPVNFLGTILQFTIKYYSGKKLGAPYAWKFISKNDKFREIIESAGKGNSNTLLALRLIPLVPVNTVSSIYGSFDFGYWRYLGISLAGFMPRIIIYTFVGRNLFDPLSNKFLVPIMLLALVTGLTLLSANGVWTLVDKFAKMYKHKKVTHAIKRSGGSIIEDDTNVSIGNADAISKSIAKANPINLAIADEIIKAEKAESDNAGSDNPENENTISNQEDSL